MCKIEKSNKDLLILLYIGAPRNIKEIQTFILNIFSDREAINFKIPILMQRLIAMLIAKIRIKKIGEIYSLLFGGKSPQVEILNSFKEKLTKLYKETHGRDLIIKYGMCYTPPYIEELFNDDLLETFDNVFVYTLYPHYSFTTAGVCIKRFFKETLKKPFSSSIKLSTYWYDNHKFNELIKERILYAASLINTTLKETVLVFAAHSLPLYTQKSGDLYSVQLRDHINIILKLLEPQLPLNYYLTYQSKATYGKWLQPYTHVVVENLIRDKVKKVIFVPITFISDHIETVYEIDQLYIKKLRDYHIDAVRIDNFNDNSDFVEAFNSMLN
jgi:ferrochelatase